MQKKFTGCLIASDLDNTLLNSKGQLSDESREAIEYFIQNGGYFTICTGRTYLSFRDMFSKVPINAPVILGNGALIYDYNNEKLIYICYLDDTSAPDIVNDVRTKFPKCACEIYGFNSVALTNINEVSENHMKNFGLEYELIPDPYKIKQPWLKAIFTGENEYLKQIEAYIRPKALQMHFVFSVPVFFEMVNGSVNKGAGVKRLADYLGVGYDKIYTVGDHLNDIDLLKSAAVSFCPENSEPEIKEIAAVILPNNNNHTIKALIEYIEKQL